MSNHAFTDLESGRRYWVPATWERKKVTLFRKYHIASEIRHWPVEFMHGQKMIVVPENWVPPRMIAQEDIRAIESAFFKRDN